MRLNINFCGICPAGLDTIVSLKQSPPPSDNKKCLSDKELRE